MPASQGGHATAPTAPGRAVEAIRGISARFLDITPDAVVISDPDGTILFVNAAAETLFGYRASELIGKPVEVLVPERFRARHVEQRRHYVATPHARLMRSGHGHLALRKDGVEVAVDVALAPWSRGGSVVTAAILRDISAQNATEQVKDKIVEIVHHELRTPLSVILGLNETLRTRGEDVPPEMRREIYEKISRRTAELMAIAGRLFAEIDRIVKAG